MSAKKNVRKAPTKARITKASPKARAAREPVRGPATRELPAESASEKQRNSPTPRAEGRRMLAARTAAPIAQGLQRGPAEPTDPAAMRGTETAQELDSAQEPSPRRVRRGKAASRPAGEDGAPDVVPPPPEALIVDPFSVESAPAPPSTPPETAAAEPAAPDAVTERLRALEARLERMIEDASTRELPGDEAPSRPPPRASLEPESEPTVFDTARELLSTDFYLRKWGRLGMRNRSEEVDGFGYDPVYDRKLQPLFDFLYDTWFRVECRGAEHVPADGRCLLVANHSGTVPYDGLMLKLALRRTHPRRREVRWLAEDFVFHFPFLGSFVNRIGAVRACQENAERLLAAGALVAVFPEGSKGIGKLFRERYRLQRFGRGGFVKLCLRTRTPIVPVAIVGAEETNPLLLRLEGAGKALGLPYVPITPTFPALGPLGLLPAPTKWRIEIGERIDLDDHGPEAEGDELLVGRLTERVRGTIQAMVDRGVAARRSVWFG
jgi:1-acyl-sn-glycerol-3-phosphate acyltransferase